MTWLNRLLAALFPPRAVQHRFEPFACRERQKWAARTAAFSSTTGPRLARGPQDRGFE